MIHPQRTNGRQFNSFKIVGHLVSGPVELVEQPRIHLGRGHQAAFGSPPEIRFAEVCRTRLVRAHE
jgi:hypothetical protein